LSYALNLDLGFLAGLISSTFFRLLAHSDIIIPNHLLAPVYLADPSYSGKIMPKFPLFITIEGLDKVNIIFYNIPILMIAANKVRMSDVEGDSLADL